MTIKLLIIGKTDTRELEDLIAVYIKRLQHYVTFRVEYLPDVRKQGTLSQAQQKNKEGLAVLKRVQPGDILFLFDEKGRQYDSEQFAQFLQKRMNTGIRQILFVIGGPYGFSPELYDRAAGEISLSKMTFSHQMVRLFVVEQLYRAFTILRNEPYHHQ